MTPDLFTDDAAPILADRSTLEQWATCPRMAFAIAHNLVANNSEATEIGTACHRAVSAVVTERIQHGTGPVPLRALLLSEACNSRPDVQPRVVQWLRSSAWSVIAIICEQPSGPERSPDDILRYDGGEGERSGQLAADIEVDGQAVRVTGEMDLLCATPSLAELDLYDWKSGYTHWTSGKVFDSFQFGTYAYLAMRNYPAVEQVNVRVCMLGEQGDTTPPVPIYRRNMHAIEARIRSAARVMLAHRDIADPLKCEAWPTPEKCLLCPYAARCAAANYAGVDIAADHERYLREFIVIEADAELRRKALADYTDQYGPLRTKLNGVDYEFSRNAPKESTRKRTAKLFVVTNRKEH